MISSRPGAGHFTADDWQAFIRQIKDGLYPS